jgi:hypothetical protein
MANPKYFPKPDDLDGHLVHAAEECSEVIKEAMKYLRFGAVFKGDNGMYINIRDDLREEINDLRGALSRLDQCLDREDRLDAEAEIGR